MITVAVDFDDTLVFQEDGVIHPVQGAREAMQKLRDMGCRIIIYTCRTGIASREDFLPEEIHFIEQALEKFGIEYDEIFIGEKLIADFYIDDRAIEFRGDWGDVMKTFKSRLRRAG